MKKYLFLMIFGVIGMCFAMQNGTQKPLKTWDQLKIDLENLREKNHQLELNNLRLSHDEKAASDKYLILWITLESERFTKTQNKQIIF